MITSPDDAVPSHNTDETPATPGDDTAAPPTGLNTALRDTAPRETAPLDTAQSEHHRSARLVPPRPPQTGDVDLDSATAELWRVQSGSFAERIDSGERVHRLLQGRLGDLGRA